MFLLGENCERNILLLGSVFRSDLFMYRILESIHQTHILHSLRAFAQLYGFIPLILVNCRFSANPEFEFRRAITKFETTETWSRMELRCQVARKWQGPMIRVAFPCFLLTLVTITSFGFDLDTEGGDRISYLVTLVLTFVAFAFVSCSKDGFLSA